MLKKLMWITAALYPVGVVFIMIANAPADQTIAGAIPGFLVFLLPLAVLVFELRGGKPANIQGGILLALLYLASLVLLGVGTAGYYAFNTTTVPNILKGIPLLGTLLALLYFAFRRIFRKKAQHPGTTPPETAA